MQARLAARLPRRQEPQAVWVGTSGHPGGDRRGGRRRLAERRRAPGRDWNARAGRRDLRGELLVLSWRERRGKAALPAAARRTEGRLQLRERLQDPADDRQLLAVRDDTLRLHSPS